MVSHDIVHIVVVPPNTIDADIVRGVAGIIEKEAYDTRLLLAGQIPRIVASQQDVAGSQLISQRLNDLGLTTFVYKDSDLRRPAQCFIAHTLQFYGNRMVFCDRDGYTTVLESKSVLLILTGRFQGSIDTETTKTKRKFSVAGTVMTGGIPIWKNVKEKTTDVVITSECFVRIYDGESPETCVEIIENEMDYSFLGEAMAPTAFVNFKTVVKILRESLPHAVFDDRLTKPLAEGDFEASCKLIYHEIELAQVG